jgi:hypothetical protein
MSIVPAALAATLAIAGANLINRLFGRLIAWIRFEGWSDTFARFFFGLFVVAIPVGAGLIIAAYGLGRLAGYTTESAAPY